MFRLFPRPRPAAPAVRRTPALRLEVLEWRDQPSSLADVPPAPPPSGTDAAAATAANNAPQIVDFECEEIAPGLFIFTGTVIDENPGGLVITFEGSVPTLDGDTTTTAADGSFSYVVQLNTNGSDAGTIGVTTTDAQGLVSNTPILNVSPTSPPPGGSP